ncbi:helicase, partial [Deinococcus cavernae]
SETVAIVNFITPGTVDGDIYERCLLRIGVFQQAIGGNEEILGEITRELHHIADSFKLSQEERERRLQQLADNSIRQIREQQELESKQAELFGINLPQQRFQEELHAARSWWVSPKALENAVTTYLKNRLELPSLPLIGDKALKSLRLSAEARTSLLGDFALLPRTNEPTARNWEKWLKGSTQSLPVTFEQEVAQAVPDVTHLSVTHPLVRQAAAFLEATQPWETSLTLPHQELPPGPHPFAVYLWKKHGVKPEDELVAVALDPAIEKALLDLLPQATDAAGQAPDQNDRNILDQRHHTLWLSAQAQHAEDNRQLVDYRIQSLTVSHQARVNAVKNQIDRATNDRIRLMKTSELTRANEDFNRRMQSLQRTAESGDIWATPILFGRLEITRQP